MLSAGRLGTGAGRVPAAWPTRKHGANNEEAAYDATLALNSKEASGRNRDADTIRDNAWEYFYNMNCTLCTGTLCLRSISARSRYCDTRQV